MSKSKRPLLFVPILCALFLVLGLTVLKPAHVSDFTAGAAAGMLLGVSILSLIVLKRQKSQSSAGN